MAWLRHRWWMVAIAVCLVAGAAWLSRSAIEDGKERRAARARIEASAKESQRLGALIVDQQADIARTLAILEEATSPAAQARNAAATARAVADLRREALCSSLYANGERPAACEDVAGRMDRIRAGEDPFTPPTTTPTPPSEDA